jgi:glycosyltransferase involved in cell wall biosynthesis
MHIVIVSDYGYISGGAAQVAIRSAIALAEAGTQVTFACALGPPTAELDRPGITVRCADASNIWAVRPAWRAAAQGIWNDAAGRWLSALLAACDPDSCVVHLHQWTKAFSPSVLAAAADSGLSVVVTLHDYFLTCPNGAYFNYPRARPCTVQPMSTACWASNCDSRSRAHKGVRLLRQMTTGAAVRQWPHPLNLIHVSQRAAEVARPLLPSAIRDWVLPNPVEPVTRPRVAAERNRPVVYIGRITREKGCVVLARAAAAAGVPLLLMGEGPALDEVRDANPQAEIRSWGNRAAVEQCFGEARVLALPSLWYETGGLVVHEALAHGVPGIVTDISGARDIVGNSHGRVVPPGDVEALAAALRELEDDVVLRQLSEQAYRDTRSGPHIPAAHASGLLDIYSEVVATHASCAA